MKLLLILFLFLIISCNDKHHLDEEKFLLVYLDLISFPDTLNNQPRSIEAFKDSVLRKHKISREDFQKTLDYYNSKPELWQEFFNKAIKYVETKNDSFFIKRK